MLTRVGVPVGLETQLSEALEKLPDVAVPSNFTARVLQAIEREEIAPRSSESATRDMGRWSSADTQA